MTSEQDSTRESPPGDLEAIINSPPSMKALKAPNWLNKISKEQAEEFLIDRILENLSRNIPDGVVRLTVENHLTVEQISQQEESKEAIKNRKREFTFELRKTDLPAFKPWVEFVPKLAGMGVAKLRFDYVAQPEIAAKDVRVTILNEQLNDVSIGCLEASIAMSIVVNKVLVKLGTIHRKLNLYHKLDDMKELPKSVVPPATQPDLSPLSENKTCPACGASVKASAKFCGNCDAKLAQ